MQIAIVGLGYVGLVSGLCLASAGHRVVGIDRQQDLVDNLNCRIPSIAEPGVSQLLQAACASNTFRATSDFGEALTNVEIVLVCVGTPTLFDGNTDLSQVYEAITSIGKYLYKADPFPVIAIRSTVPVGTLSECTKILEQSSRLHAGRDFGIGLNPEFLREGSAVRDFTNPPYIVINREDQRVTDRLTEMYSVINAPIQLVSTGAAEMIKFAANAFHAMKVCFSNETGAICKAAGVDGRELMDLLCKDRQLNVSEAYLKPGSAFGGSCLPKDLRALKRLSEKLQVKTSLIDQIEASNEDHLQRAIELIKSQKNRRLGFLGLTFKPDTSDIRNSPTVSIIDCLMGQGYQIRIFDPHIIPDTDCTLFSHPLKSRLDLSPLMSGSIDEVLKFAETIVITYNCESFRNIWKHINERQSLVDLTSLPGSESITGLYHGICW